MVLTLCSEEMIESDLIQRGRGSIGRYVTANAGLLPVGADDHGQRVPPHQTSNTPFDFTFTRIDGLFVGRNGIDVSSVRGKRY